MEARIEAIKDNGYEPTSQYDFLAGKVQKMEFDNFKATFTHEIEKTHTHMEAMESRLNARIDVVAEQIKSTKNELTEQIRSTNARIDGVDKRIDSLETSLNARIDGVDKRIDSLETSLNARIDSLDTSLNGRIDDMKTIVDKTDKRISNMLVLFGIAFAGIFTVLGVILSKLG